MGGKMNCIGVKRGESGSQNIHPAGSWSKLVTGLGLRFQLGWVYPIPSPTIDVLISIKPSSVVNYP
ncbi:hypothetical protein KY285_029730 [Solanum tuberosum]|nr:hypothetical protein KY284_029691 [Solanum tuberosum]KAH0654848.1 hypothetical protein KY285_029730 [Solanum tuberosum]